MPVSNTGGYSETDGYRLTLKSTQEHPVKHRMAKSVRSHSYEDLPEVGWGGRSQGKERGGWVGGGAANAQ